MPLAAQRTDTGPDLIALAQEATGAVEALLADATRKVRERVSVDGRPSSKLIDREQRADPRAGLAWRPMSRRCGSCPPTPRA